MGAQPGWPILHGTPMVQRRVSIARPPAPPTEDSDVLVLNSRSTLPDSSVVGAKVLYLDLRLSLPITGAASINWAFAGLRETVPLDGAEENAVRYRWKHTVDSHGRSEPPDEGTMVKCKNRSGQSVEVETGVGIDPKTGKLGPYEEVWKLEHITPGTPFVFLTSNEDPNQSVRFMAVLGLHALGIWKMDADEGFSTSLRSELRQLHVVRLRSDSDKYWNKSKHSTYSTVFSTGYQTLDDQLGKLVDEVLVRGMEGRRLWQRGERLTLRDKRGRPSIWAVWDAGHVDN